MTGAILNEQGDTISHDAVPVLAATAWKTNAEMIADCVLASAT